MRRGVVAFVLLLTACEGEPEAVRSVAPPSVAMPLAPAANTRLAEDVGGWTPPDDLVEAALALGDRPDRTAAIAALDAMTPAQRIDVLRAGLRLRDRPAAIACAARLSYKVMDRWECARAVDLLTPEVFRPGTEADFEEYRSYLGSVELAHVLRSLPPTPWDTDTVPTFAQFHRVALGEHLPLYCAVSLRPDPVLAEAAWSDVRLLRRWNDEHREDVACAQRACTPSSLPPQREGSGLPPALDTLLETYREGVDLPREHDLPWLLRWCRSVRPGPADEDLLLDLAENCGDDGWSLGGTARMMLGLLDGKKAEAWLRADHAQGSEVSLLALARRGGAEDVARVARLAERGDSVALAVYLETLPPEPADRLGNWFMDPAWDKAAPALLAYREFAAPGARTDAFGVDWRRARVDEIEARARNYLAQGRIDGERAALLGISVPGCRTKALAEAAAREFSLRWFDEKRAGEVTYPEDEILAFLETGAPETFRQRLKAIAAELAVRDEAARPDGSTDAQLAADLESVRDLLAAVGDPAPGESLADCVRRQIVTRERGDLEWGYLGARALARLHDLPDVIARELAEDRNDPGVQEALRDGRPIDALALVLAAHPDEAFRDVGLVDDPRVRAYLVRLRERRDLELHWYATGELAVLGDPDARAEFWGAMQDGRYRVIEEFGEVPRTLGLDLPATMPFWIGQLRSQCCRCAAGASGDLTEDILGIDGGDTTSRTPYERAKELWDAAGGRFVWSRWLGRFVPEPR